MDVVGHDHQGVEHVPLTIEVVEGVGDDGAEFGAGEQAFAMAFIEPFFGAIVEAELVFLIGLVVPWLRVVLIPCGEVFAQFREFDGGNGIGEAEGDKIRAVLLLPVWEVAAGFFGFRLVWSEGVEVGG